MKHTLNLLPNSRALSPIFATLILVAIVMVFGTAAYYYASNVTTSATNQLTSQIGGSQQTVSERLSFEKVLYTAPVPTTSTQGTLKVYLINSGPASDIKINSVFIYDCNRAIKGIYSVTPSSATTSMSSVSNLFKIDGATPVPISSLDSTTNREGYFIINLGKVSSNFVSLPSTDGPYDIHIITQNEATFDYVFTP